MTTLSPSECHALMTRAWNLGDRARAAGLAEKLLAAAENGTPGVLPHMVANATAIGRSTRRENAAAAATEGSDAT